MPSPTVQGYFFVCADTPQPPRQAKPATPPQERNCPSRRVASAQPTFHLFALSDRIHNVLFAISPNIHNQAVLYSL